MELIGNGLDVNGLKNTKKYNYVDCLYILIILKYGLLFFIACIYMLTSTSFFLYKKKEYYLVLLMFIIAIHGIIDDLMIFLYFNSFWLVVGKMILNNKYNVERSAIDVEKISC